MKNKVIMMALVMSTITTGIFAQARPQTKTLTDAQKEQISEIKEKYAPAISELRQEIRITSTEQHGLLTSKTIDEKAIYANIDKSGQLKADMQKKTLAMRGEMMEICPFNSQARNQSIHKGNMPEKRAYNKRQDQNKQGQNTQGLHQKRSQNTQSMSSKGKKAYAAKGQQNHGKTKGQGMQKGVRGQGNNINANSPRQTNLLKLSPEQTAEMAKIKKEHFWEIQETQNALALLKVKNVSLENQLKAVDEISALQTKLTKQKMGLKLATMKVLTEEQRIMTIAKRGHNQGHGKSQRPNNGMNRAHQNRG